MSSRTQFDFENLQAWKKAADVSVDLIRLADDLNQRGLQRFADQLRVAMLGISNNLAASSCMELPQEIDSFLNRARRCVVEVANILVLVNRGTVVEVPDLDGLLRELEQLNRLITETRREDVEVDRR